MKHSQRYEISWLENDAFENRLPDEERKKHQKQNLNWTRKCWNHPRTQVDWYEAVAFCRWLSATLGYEVRLPTTPEWQKAARGTDGRMYPWGNTFDATKANTSETQIWTTTTVGLFPDGASPYGALDMSGNVFEWMLNEFDGTIESDLANIVEPALCGGAYSQFKDDARVTAQADNPPEKSLNFGFRVLCSG